MYNNDFSDFFKIYVLHGSVETRLKRGRISNN